MSERIPIRFQPSFIACMVILAVFAATKELVIRVLGVQLTKQPIPLKKSLSEMEETKLTGYQVRDKQTITNKDVLESLGTEQYIQWTLEDEKAEPDSPTRYCSLFITYYTGNPDMVPHVPDECYTGGGMVREDAETLTCRIEVPAAASASAQSPVPNTIPFQYVTFSKKEKSGINSETRFSVQYCFKANGEFRGSRTETRTVLGKNFFSKYSYFAKIEWKFYGFDFAGLVYPNKEQTLEASRKLLSIVLPVLEEDHWPDWEKAKSGLIE